MTYGLSEADLCPHCNSKLWTCVKYSAVTTKFYFSCHDCKHSEIRDWIYE